MGAWLGLDFGEKRIGVAVGDELSSMAFPLTTFSFQGRKGLLEDLKKVIAEYQITGIVAGLPKTLKNENGPAAQKVTAHVDWLKTQLDLEWVLWDERLTTQEVERVLLDADLSRDKRKMARDRLAAQRILQNYLDYHRLRNEKDL